MSDLLVSGGQVLHPDGSVSESDVLVDQGKGVIQAIDDPGTLGPGDTELDATDALVMPGLVNAHTHVAMTLLRGYADDKPLDAWLQEDIWPVEAELTADDIQAGAELGLVEMIRSGTTAFSDMYFHVDRIADAVDRAGLRAVLGHTAISVGKDEEAAREDMETSLAVAQELDGVADGRITTSFQPHSLTTVEQPYLAEFIPQARAAGIPLHFHANETRDEVKPIVAEHDQRPLAYADDLDMLSPTDFLAHGVHVTDEEIDLLAERGTGVVHCPASNMKLASGMAPVQAMVEAGVTVGIGTDGAASNNDLDMFDEMRDAAMLGKLAADDASAMAADTVVDAATQGGASLLGLSAGRIEPGAAADLAVLDLTAPHLTPQHDVVSHLAYAASGSDARHTVCDGEILMRDRSITALDAAAVCDNARKHASAVVERAEAADQ
jgi:5-methylthioadenosine/S-adenosylhomocysteine deaminase